MYEYKIELLRVVDGDTIEAYIDLGFHTFLKKSIRLDGINSPEKRTSNKREKLCGCAAEKWLQDQIIGKALSINTKKNPFGKYGRPVGTLWINEDVDLFTNVCLNALSSGLYMPYGLKWYKLTEEKKHEFHVNAKKYLGVTNE